jgi:hypothetical protein
MTVQERPALVEEGEERPVQTDKTELGPEQGLEREPLLGRSGLALGPGLERALGTTAGPGPGPEPGRTGRHHLRRLNICYNIL